MPAKPPQKSRQKPQPSKFGQILGGAVRALPQEMPTLEQIIGSNLSKGDFNPLRGIVGMTEDYNTAFTGFDPQGQQVPNIARALTLALPGGGGGPAGSAASGVGRKLSKDIAESLMRQIDEDIVAKTGNATAALRKATTKPKDIVGFKQDIKPKDVFSTGEKTGAFVIDDLGRTVQVSAHSKDAHNSLVRISSFIQEGTGIVHAGIQLPANVTSGMVKSIRQLKIDQQLGQIAIYDASGKLVKLADLDKLIK